jgi:adenylate cyclase class 2
MIEHEKKFRLKDPTDFEIKTSKLNFVAGKESYQKDTYFSRPDVDFMETKECLRIRIETDLTEITYKPPTTRSMAASQSIWKREINLTVKDETAAKEFLLALGSIELCTVEKRRKEFLRGNITVSIDHITDLGDFVEIEIIAQEEDTTLLDKINEVATELGLSDSEVVSLPYRDLLMGRSN